MVRVMSVVPQSYCPPLSSSSSVLRFTTMVEVMAPMFEADFFRGLVAPTLHNAWSGWGLDFVWWVRGSSGVLDGQEAGAVGPGLCLMRVCESTCEGVLEWREAKRRWLRWLWFCETPLHMPCLAPSLTP